jgi:HEAT repeat protein
VTCDKKPSPRKPKLIRHYFLTPTKTAPPRLSHPHIPQTAKMAESAPSQVAQSIPETQDPTILALRTSLTTESTPLAQRFRALFSLKHLASQSEDSPQTLPAIQAIAAAFASPSALLKHEVAYCLGQTKNLVAAQYLRAVLEDVAEDSMCRHEAAEALGALGDTGSIALLKDFRDKEGEVDVVRETCEIAVARIEWENSEESKKEKLQKRYVGLFGSLRHAILIFVVILLLLTPLRQRRRTLQLKISRRPC